MLLPMSQGLCILRREGLFWAREICGACQHHFSGNIGNAAEMEVEDKMPKYNPVTSAWDPGSRQGNLAREHLFRSRRGGRTETFKILRHAFCLLFLSGIEGNSISMPS